ncbi:MAG TPA: leucyl/phenylalanyl-tRNA--protein transferase [Pyrinomonadaceae bacterium]|jgi:leucyl/phenylalanyl-tRNA--protein transferase|nr:leucyl/phenylalanyl-tRNA--protein transferase [Pyrinomonadaceae bacterium]
MALIRFPDPRYTTAEGIVAIGGDLRPENVLEAYRRGIFPWPIDGLPLTWFCPPERAILDFADLHVPRSLARERRRTRLRFTVDHDFNAVIRACAKTARAGESGTWITPGVIRAYGELHRRGHVHSVEAWDDEEEEALVGGVYGVDADGAFAGESMFYLRPNASKLALLFLIEHLSRGGLDWIDIQMMTPHMQTLGAKLISRDRFLEKLAHTRARGLQLFKAARASNGN